MAANPSSGMLLRSLKMSVFSLRITVKVSWLRQYFLCILARNEKELKVKPATSFKYFQYLLPEI